MKFYYKGHLIRTSKTHNYTHALIDTSDYGCVACSSQGPARCEAEKTRFVANLAKNVAYYTSRGDHEKARQSEQWRAQAEANWRVVPLEAR